MCVNKLRRNSVFESKLGAARKVIFKVMVGVRWGPAKVTGV